MLPSGITSRQQRNGNNATAIVAFRQRGVSERKPVEVFVGLR